MKLPRALLGISCAVLVAALLTLFAGAVTTGVTTDEPYHVQRFNNWLESGWYVADFQEVDGQPSPQTSDQYVYGPATTGLLHLWNRVLGTDRAGEATVSADAYLTRHLGVALISLLAVVAVIALGRILLRSWGWGIVAAACLVAIPLWTGHAMFNVKDPPVAAGYTLVTLGLVLVLRERAGDWRIRLAVVGLLAAGTFVTIGTRPGMWAGLLVSLTVMLVGLGWSGAGGWPRKLGESLAGVAIGLAGCLALYPNVFGEPITAMTESFSGSATYNDDVHDRTWLTDRLGIYLPTLIGLLAVLGLVTVVRRVWRARGSSNPQWIRWSLVGAQLLVFPVAAVVFGTPLDGDLRQLLLSLPALAVMAAVGAQWLVTRAGEAKWPRLVAPGVVAVALVVPVVDSATLFPYNYLYFTPAADALGADRHAQADNWTAGGR
ncbi:MAG: hypothetical protein ACSLEW_01240, partial [Nocardioides sp.]